jgi:hypothetical protein
MAWRLEYYWVQTEVGDEAGTAWGQLAGAAHRLLFVCEELVACRADRNLEHLLPRLAYHMENYLVRIYELRERLVMLVAAMDGQSDLAKSLKSKKKRGAALQALENRHEERFITVLESLLSKMDPDIELRNQHTHDKFLSVGIWTGDDIFDPADALLDVSHNAEASKQLRQFLRKDIKRLVTQYDEKGRDIIDSTFSFLRIVDDVRRGSEPTSEFDPDR